jgi:hypothetical protein
MSMQAASLEVLEKANLPAPQARAIVQAIEIEMNATQTTLATKQDLNTLATKQDLTAFATKQDLKQAMSDIAHALELEIDALRTELRAEMHALARDIVRHLYVVIFAVVFVQTTILTGLGYLALSHLKP